MEKKKYIISVWGDDVHSIEYELTKDEFLLIEDIEKKLNESSRRCNYDGSFEIQEV